MSKNNLLGLDVGEKRVGVAIVADGLSVPRSLPTLANDDNLFAELGNIISNRAIDRVVVGLPRNLRGEETAQTAYVRSFSDKLAASTSLPITFQDEALTSVMAEDSLNLTGKTFQKSDIDSLAARTILSDYLVGIEAKP